MTARLMLPRTLVRTTALALAVTAGTLVAANSTQAQVQVRVGGGPGGPMFGGPGGGGVSRTSLDQYARILGLTDAQKESAAALHEAYVQDRSAAARDMQEQMKAAREGMQDGDFSAMRDQVPAIMRKYGEKTGALEKQFVDDLKTLLTPAQADKWPAVERLRRRDQWLRGGGGPFGGGVSGASVDLVSLVDGLKLPDADRTKLGAALDEYEQTMDRALQEREHAMEEERARDDGPRNFDPESIQAMMKKQTEQAMKIREVNQRYARILASLLPDDRKAALEDQFKVKSFRQVYGDSSATRRLSAAEKLDDLTAEQKQRLSQIRDTYRQAARPLNDRWASAQEQAENDGKFAVLPFFGGPGDDGNDELSSARKARRDLDKKTSDQVNEVLTADQRDRMPQNQANAQFARFGGGPMMIDGDDADAGPGGFMMIHSEDNGDGVATHAVIIGGPGVVTGDGSGDGSTVKIVQPTPAQPASTPKTPPKK